MDQERKLGAQLETFALHIECSILNIGIVRIDSLIAFDCMGVGALPLLVAGVICLVNSMNALLLIC